MTGEVTDSVARALAWGGPGVAFLGVVLAGLSLRLQFVRHRRDRPILRLEASVGEPEGFGHFPYPVKFTLYNEGRAATRVTEVRLACTTQGVVFAAPPATAHPRGKQLAALDFLPWDIDVNPLGIDDRQAEFVVTVEAVGADPVNASFTLRASPLSEGFSRQLGLIDEDTDTSPGLGVE
jgi:hypothetical protein